MYRHRRLLVVLPAAVSVAGIAVAVTWPRARTAGWDAAWTAAALSALAGMVSARRAADASQRARWTCWALATASWTAGQLAWDAAPLLGSPGSPSLADIGWWGFAALVIAGLVRNSPGPRAVRLVALVEAVPLIAAAVALTFAELWERASSSPLPVDDRAAALAYPVIYVSAAVLTMQAMIGGALRRAVGPGLRLVLAGTVAQAAAFILWSNQLLAGTYAVGSTLIDPLWVVGMLAIGAGGVQAGGDPEPPSHAEEPGARGALLPALTFFVLMAALVRASFDPPPAGARLVLAAGVVMCGATLVARSVLLSRRQRDLLERERAARLKLAAREAELARLNARLAEDSRRDPLTGLRNRRALGEELPALESRARRHGEPFAVALCDVDRFKAYNDRLGHLAGDAALRLLAETVAAELRMEDGAYRYGGEELLLVLPGAGERDAVGVAERVRAAVSDAGLAHPAGIGGVLTVSIGVAAGTADARALLARADAALYAAKAAGRNRTMTAAPAAIAA